MVLLQHNKRNDGESEEYENDDRNEERDNDIEPFGGEEMDSFIRCFDSEFLYGGVS